MEHEFAEDVTMLSTAQQPSKAVANALVDNKNVGNKADPEDEGEGGGESALDLPEETVLGEQEALARREKDDEAKYDLLPDVTFMRGMAKEYALRVEETLVLEAIGRTA